MKSMVRGLLVWLSLALLMGMQTGWADETVRATGSCWLNGLSEEAALEIAKSEAKRRALEQAGRTAVMQHTATGNMALVADAVVTQTTGIFKRLDWGRSWQDGGKVFVELTAVVASEQLRADFMAIEAALKQKGLPRVGVLVSTRITDQKGSDLSASLPYSALGESIGSGIKSYFMSVTPEMNLVYRSADGRSNAAGLARKFNAAAAADRNVNLSHEELKAAAGRGDLRAEVEAQALARELGADLVIAGEVEMSVNARDLRGIPAVSLTVTPRLQVVDAHSGKTLALDQQSFSLGPVATAQAQNSLQTALHEIGKREGAELIGQLVRHWCRARTQVQLLVRGTTQSQLSALRTRLGDAGGEQNFVVRSLRDGVATVDYFSELPPEQLAALIDGMSPALFRVESMPEGRLQLVPAGFPDSIGLSGKRLAAVCVIAVLMVVLGIAIFVLLRKRAAPAGIREGDAHEHS